MTLRRLLILAAAGALVAAAGTATARADTADDHYLSTLATHGITGDPQALIGAGRDVCWALAQNWVVIGEALWKPQAEYAGLGIVGPQYGQARHDAVNSYCPDLSSWRN